MKIFYKDENITLQHYYSIDKQEEKENYQMSIFDFEEEGD